MSTEKIRIVIADDHKVVREGTRELLQKEDDLEVVGEAGDGKEAVNLVKKLEPDVVIMDIAMPRLNGIEATKQIKAILPGIAVLVLTGYEYDQYVFALLEAGAAGYLLKDVRGQEVIDAVRAVRAGESVLHPVVARKALDHFVRPEDKEKSPRLQTLTDREIEVLRLAANGHGNKEIARVLDLSVRTVQAHLGNIFNKLKVGSRTEAVIAGLKNGLLTLEDIAES
ncbi:MAG: response regulator transcription factor [Chloroflexota bacterium]|nr:response regulator transcription factor [Chloroflexota bacterium]